MTGEIGLEWIKHFDKHTVAQANGAPRLLLVDGHISHYTLELLDYARENNIIILCYPAHSTHVFQGLDVVCFGRLKELYSRYAGEYEDQTGQKISKNVFLTPFSKAYVETFTPDTIKSAFASTGVHPFNRDILTSDAMVPSLATSIQGGLPFQVPEPVMEAVNRWDQLCEAPREESPEWDIELRDVAPNEPIAQETMATGIRDVDMRAVVVSEDQTPGGDHEGTPSSSSEPINLEEHEPKNVHTALAQLSAAFLLGDVPITSQYQLKDLPFYHMPPAPLADSHVETPQTEQEIEFTRQLNEMRRREAEIMAAYRGAQAQLVLASRHCTLLQGQLNAKESAAAAKRDGKGKGKLMGDGFGRVTTQGAFYDQAVENRRVSIEEERAKRQREEKNATKKRMREEWSEQERARKEADKEAYRLYKEGALAAWETESNARKAEGRKARWAKPKPPRRSKPIPKPWVVQEDVEANVQAAGDTMDVDEAIDEEAEDESETESDEDAAE